MCSQNDKVERRKDVEFLNRFPFFGSHTTNVESETVKKSRPFLFGLQPPEKGMVYSDYVLTVAVEQVSDVASSWVATKSSKFSGVTLGAYSNSTPES